MENLNPKIYFRSVNEDEVTEISAKSLFLDEEFNQESGIISSNDIFDYIKDIIDPEYPLTLEQLNVVSLENIIVNNEDKIVIVFFKPTVTTCSQASLIGLSIYFKLRTVLNKNTKIIIKVLKDTHDLEDSINKQLKDKERVVAALENPQIFKTITKGLINSDKWEDESFLY